MTRNTIKVYARLKPQTNQQHSLKYRILRRSNDRKTDSLVLLAPFKPDEFIDHRPESWIFSFHRIIEEEANQQDVFENIGRPVIDSVLNGYNGTVFAYGQTGSGKTYTITGQISSNKCQGIVPRSLSYLFDFIKMHPENIYSVDVAYLEIYNEYGYDLLDRKQQQQQQQQQQVQVQQAMRLEDLPRVRIQEDEKGKLHLKNLTFHNVKSEDRAMELFLIGDSRRVTVDTPTNPQSSRSHCIFTIVVSIKQFGANRYKKAKMHLVDLAGSERVYKCEISGTVLTEAKHINLSLHYLEQVIVCLNQENSSHIPYRNCLLTAILRDSLGGNCITTMLATLSISSVNLQETISTCRFAQRVALVRNEAKLILDHDLDSENKLLQLENEKLRKQIEELKNTLSLQDNKDRHDEKLDYYKNLVMQRDQEISVLLGLLKKAKAKLAQPEDLNKMVIKSKLKIRSKESIAERLSKTTTKVLEPIEKHDVENNTLFEIKHSNLLEKSLEEKSIIEENIEKKDIPFNDSSKETNSLKQSFNLGTSNIEKDLEVKKIDENVDDNDMSCVHSNETSVNQLCNLIINNDNLVNNSITNDDQLIERQHIEEKVKSNNIDNDLEKNLPLTGDPEIDEEIIAFYKAKRSGGIY
ncbi:PREDICTED: kinesin-like protein KIF6 [Polistes dominula]|uniref:Kinesin-like protein n=1 Tax=Polistes dominula TaxID=743375 RepID=A0ABM1IG40_POLDO|nr:PREDICTED: kinesin-like protein KIF6 [Polistes dominula]